MKDYGPMKSSMFSIENWLCPNSRVWLEKADQDIASAQENFLAGRYANAARENGEG